MATSISSGALLLCSLVGCRDPLLQETIAVGRGEATSFTVDNTGPYTSDVRSDREWHSIFEADARPLSVAATYPDGATVSFAIGVGCFSDDTPTSAEIDVITCSYQIKRHHSFGGVLQDAGADGTCTCEGPGTRYACDSTSTD